MKNIVVLLILGLTCLTLESPESTITKLQVMFRHGYRYPTGLKWTENDTCAETYVNEPWKLGNLTDLGKSQMRLLGYFLRIRYNSLIGDDAAMIQVNYSDCNRDKESAELVYEALFKDFDNTTDLIVSVMNKTIEGKLATNDTYYYTWLEGIPWSKDLHDQCQNLNIIPTLSCENRRQFHKFAGQMICEQPEDCSLPIWLEPKVQENFIAEFNEMYQSLQLCSSKTFIEDNSDEMLKWINDVFNNDDEDAFKDVQLYASHDLNIGIILTRMGVFNSLPVPFGAALVFEQHIIENNTMIRLFYDNSTDYSNFQQLRVPGCDWDCPYEKFVEIVTGPYPCSSTMYLRFRAVDLVIVVIGSHVSSWLLF